MPRDIKTEKNYFWIEIIYKCCFFYDNKRETILIGVDISGGLIGQHGLVKFVQGINDILPYNTNKCRFISSKKIYPINGKNRIDFFSSLCKIKWKYLLNG